MGVIASETVFVNLADGMSVCIPRAVLKMQLQLVIVAYVKGDQRLEMK